MIHFTRQQIRRGLVVIALCLVMFGIACAAPATPSEADQAAALATMNDMHKSGKYQQLIDQFKNVDFAGWKESGTAYYYRGVAYYQLKDSAHALPDLKKSVELEPDEGYFWYNLGKTYQELLKDDAAAVAAFANAHRGEPKSSWMVIDATLTAVDILLHKAKGNEALRVMQVYSDEDINGLGAQARVKVLQTYGEIYISLGEEDEAWAKFRAALAVENQ